MTDDVSQCFDLEAFLPEHSCGLALASQWPWIGERNTQVFRTASSLHNVYRYCCYCQAMIGLQWTSGQVVKWSVCWQDQIRTHSQHTANVVTYLLTYLLTCLLPVWLLLCCYSTHYLFDFICALARPSLSHYSLNENSDEYLTQIIMLLYLRVFCFCVLFRN